ncbi:MAG: hypothetical protein OXG47_07685 [bacterium]|nr:hypothetical protein [bacterium]MCY3925036.1 hypothetical protein [bacterium]
MGMRKELREQTFRAGATQPAAGCTCSPIRWASPVLDDIDPVDLPCPALAAEPQARVPRPRLARQITTWDWSRSGRRQQRPQAA